MNSKHISIQVADLGTVSGILEKPRGATHLLVLAHGAGAGMEHRNMAALAAALHEQKIATLRYNFLYMEAGKKAPDRPPKAMAAVQAAVNTARRASKLPLLAGGKSFGGRMTSTAASEGMLEGLGGLVFFGWPLHAPGKDGTARAAHLAGVKIPTLFLQGTRDTLARKDLMEEVHSGLKRSRLVFFEGADHSFHVLKRSGRTDEEVMALIAENTRAWLDAGMRGGKLNGR
jgi:predicted alpha/beta-hydrolase family hydrolase